MESEVHYLNWELKRKHGKQNTGKLDKEKN